MNNQEPNPPLKCELVEGMKIFYTEHAKYGLSELIHWPGILLEISIRLQSFKFDYLEYIYPNGFESNSIAPYFPNKHNPPEITATIEKEFNGRAFIFKVSIPNTGIAYSELFTFDMYARINPEISQSVKNLFAIENKSAHGMFTTMIDFAFERFTKSIVVNSIEAKFTKYVYEEQSKRDAFGAKNI